ncbi:MAG TPA: hypothetical protein VNU46_07410 [Gemmatimonadaceae bacterium]|nr:hypothetical protein [Gemmatimonadaceae bacterium]
MSDDHMIDWFLLERYFAGTVSPVERTQIEHWIAANADWRETIQRIQAALHARGRRRQQDWRRNDAIETVLTQVRSGRPASALTILPQQPNSAGRSTTVRMVETLRHWFEGATELAAAMVLDANEQPLSAEETKVLRKQIDDWERGEHER